MKDFIYLAPTTMEQALEMLTEHEGKLSILNGGTDLIVRMRDYISTPEYVMDIKGIEELHKVTFDEQNGLFIGACVNLNMLGENPDIKKYFSYFSDAALRVGSRQVRNRATCIGNICNASPLADTATPLVAHEALIHIAGKRGNRIVPIKEFFVFVRKTSLAPDELVTGIQVPYLKDSKGVFTKISRRKEVDLSTVCATVVQQGDAFRIAFGSVAPTPIRAPKTEALLKGKAITPELIAEAAELAATEISPIDDLRGSKQYRIDVVKVIIKRSLEELCC